MNDVSELRNVVERWTDVKKPRAQKMHDRVAKGRLRISLDESSIAILGPDEVFKGALNLHDVYKYAAEKLGQIG